MKIDDPIQIKNSDTHSVIKLKGFIDASTIQKIRPIVDKKLDENSKNIIVDLLDVGFIDSHCIGFFVSLLKKAHAREGLLTIVGATGQPEAVMQMVGFNNDLVSYCDNMTEAKALLK